MDGQVARVELVVQPWSGLRVGGHRRLAERPRIHDPVRPCVAAVGQLLREERHRRSAVEPQHEGHVLEEQPLGRVAIDEAEDLGHETRVPAPDPGGATSLGQVLAGEAGGYDLRVRERVDLPNIADERNIGEPILQHGLRRIPDLAQEDGLEAGLVEAELEPADPREEACDPWRGFGGMVDRS